jgi:hypothetical protein
LLNILARIDLSRPLTAPVFAQKPVPRLELSGPDDASNLGWWIPTIAVDQLAATPATWFGADAAALASVLPNLSSFSPSTLGFI